MACGRCGEANRDDAQFCASCGAALVAPCPSCGALPHGPAARFCDRCGTELAGGAVAAQARKVVTVLFADLVGSTATQEQMDPESVRRWMDRYYAVLRTEVQAQGGRVVKFIGDGMMAVFGIPEVREDDARRALVAAMAMHAAVTELGTELATRAEVRIGLRVGVNTGEVVVAERDDDVVGDVVNVAARLADAAGPGEVLVGETTFRLVRLGAQLRALPPLTLKGKAEPVNAFHLVSLEGRPEVVVTSPFVGRVGDLERLFALLESSLNEKRTNLASIVGSPGVGKTRLARELAARAGDRARVVDVRCDPSGGATFAPIAAAIRLAASLQDDASDDTIVAALTALFDESEPERARIASIVAALLGVGEPGLPEETFWAVRRLIENAARVRPLLFLFDDVHWAEPLLLDLIENMAEWVRDVPVLLVVTARPELRDLRPSLVEVGGRVGAAIHLEGLDVDESRRLTRALLEGAALPEALLDRIATASEGNPLFVGELVRMLVDDGALRREGDRWTATVDLDELEVPVSIHALLAARIDRLPAGERTVLEAASVVGKTFYRGVVAELVDADVRRKLDEHFESLRRKEMIEPTGTYWLDQPVLRFHHVLIRDAAYRRLLKEARATLHERAAEWFEVKVGELVEHDDVIGFQLEQAHLLREELGETDATLGHAASDRLAAAGRRALEADDRPGAAGLLGRAVGCLPADDARRPQLLIDRAEALLAMGDVTDAAPVVDALAEVAPGDPRLEAWVTCFAGELANLRDPRHLAKTADEAAAAAEALAELGDDAGVAKAHWVRAASLARLGRIAECEGSLDRALGSARRAGDRRRATAILAGAPTAALWGPNPVTRASGRCLDVVRVLRITSRAPAVEATSLRCQAVLEGLRGRDEAARRMLSNARNALEELGHAHGLLELDMAAGMVEMMSGAPAAAERYLRRAHEGFHELGIDVDAGLAAALLARIRIGQGAPDEALELTEESEQLVGDDLKAGIAWRAVRAEALAHAGDLAEARRLAEEAVAMASPTDALVDHADALLSLAEVRRLAGDATGAAEAAQRALDLYERKEATVSAERARGYLSGAGAPAEARTAASSEDAGSAAPDNDAIRRFRALATLVFGGRWDAVPQSVAEDIRSVDHRPLGGPPAIGVEAYLEAMRGVLEVGAHDMVVTTVETRGERLAVVRCRYLVGDGAVLGDLEVLQLIEIDDAGRFVTNDIYDLDQIDEARADLDRRAPSAARPVLSNMATRAGLAVYEHGVHGRWAEAAALCRPDVAYVDHRPLVGGVEGTDRGDYMAAAQSIFASGVTDLSFEVVALRGERLGLGTQVYRGGAAEVEALGILETDEAGLVASLAAYDVDQMVEAQAELERRYAEELGEELGEVWLACTRLLAGIVALDWTAMRAALSDDLIGVDHRPLGWGTFDADSYVLLYRTVAELTSDWWHGAHEVLAVTPFGCCVVAAGHGTTVDGSEFRTVGIITFRVCDGRVDRVDVFPLDQPELGLACLHGFGGSPRLENAATRAAEASVAAVLRGDWDAFESMTSDETVGVDHRALVGSEVVGLDAAVAANRGLVEVGVTSIVLSPVAIEGDRWALQTASFKGSDGDWSVDVLHLLGVDARGLAHRAEIFDLDQLDVALARLAELSGSGTANTDLELENGASRATREIWEALLDHDRAGVAERLHPDAICADRRPLLREWQEYLGREASTDWIMSIAEIGVDSIERSVVAVRGEHLVVLDVLYAGARAATRLVQLVELDASGLMRRSELFDLDQLREAVTRLDELYGESLDDERRPTWEGVRAFTEAFGANDVTALSALVSADTSIVDHRPASFGTEAWSTWAEVFGTEFDEAPGTWLLARSVLGLSSSACLTSSEVRGFRDGGAFANPMLNVAAIKDGLLVEAHLYSPEDRPSAEAKFAELELRHAAQPPERAAIRTARLTFDRALAGDWDGLTALFRPDIRITDRRPMFSGVDALGLEAFVAYTQAIFAVGVAAIDVDAIASRGDHLGLLRIVYRMADDLAQVEVLLLVETDDAGLGASGEIYDADQLDEATALLDERYLAGEAAGSEAWTALVEGIEGVNRRDLEPMRARLDEGFVAVDHRPMGWGRLDRDTYPRLYQAAWEQSPGVRWTLVADHVVSDEVVCVSVDVAGPGEGSSGPFSIPSVNVLCQRAGRLLRHESFPPDGLDRAVARARELGEEAADMPFVRRVVLEFAARCVAGDPAGIQAAFAPAGYLFDHRPIVGGQRFEGPELQRALAVMAELGASSIEWDPIATRGDLLELGRTTFSGQSAVTEVLMVGAVDRTGSVEAWDVYDPDQVDEAFAELDARYLASLEPDRAEVARVTYALVDAQQRRDLAGMDALLAPDYTVTDHRMLSGGVFGRVAYLETFGPLFEASPDVRWRVIRDLGICGRGIYAQMEMQGTRDGGAFSSSFLAIARVADGTVSSLEAFPIEQRAGADARWAELVAEPHETMARTAWLVHLEAARRLDGEGMIAMTSPDIRMVDHRALVGGGITSGHRQVRAIVDGFTSLGRMHIDSEQIAARGERLELNRTRFHGRDAELEMLFLLHVDERGLIDVMETFDTDDLSSAQERFAELAGDDDAGTDRLDLENEAMRAQRALHTRMLAEDWDGVAAGCHPDVVLADRRPLVGGDTWDGPTAVVEFCRSVVGLGARAVDLTPIAQRGERLVLLRAIHSGTDASIETVQVVEIDEAGLTTAVDLFAPDQIQTAFELLDERYRAILAPDDAETLRVIMAVRDALNAKDLEPLRELMPPEMVWVDHRPAAYGAPESGTWLNVFEELFADSPDSWWLTRKPLGLQRGVFYSWTDIRGSLDGSNWVTPMISMLSVRDGRFTTIDFYEVEDVAAADARFAELVAERAGNLAVRAFDRSIQLNIAGRVDELVDLYAVDVIARDHRPVIGGLQLEGRNEVKSLNTALEEWKWDRVHREVLDQCGDRCALIHATLGDESADVSVLVLQAVDDHGLIASIDLFDPDQLDEARVALDDVSGKDRTLFERTWDAFRSAAERGDLAALVDLLAPEATMADRRHLIGGLSLTGDELTRALEAFVSLTPMTIGWAPVATRGQLLGLGRSKFSGRDAEVDALTLGEVDDHGKVSRIVNFDPDQLDEATAELDDLFLAGEGAAHAATWRVSEDFRAAVNTHDAARIETVVRRDLVVVDHRLLGWGTLDASEYLSMQVALAETAPDSVLRMVRDLGSTEHHLYGHFETSGTRDGGAFVSPMLVIGTIRDGRTVHLEIFAPEDRAAADARFAELSAGRV